MKIKVCGLSKILEVETCRNLGVNYCGFILNYPKSHRFISYEHAKTLTEIKKGNSKYVGVLVNPTHEDLEKFAKLNIDYFQLYGEFDNKNLAEIKNSYKKKIISTIQVKKVEDVNKFKRIESQSDIILWDSSGYEKSLDWNYEWIKKINVKAEKMIAGNITADKLKKIKGLADIIDVSGALETNKVKDINKIKNFVNSLHKLNE